MKQDIKEVRPFPIRHIKSSFWRKTSIILGFIPLFFIGIFLDVVLLPFMLIRRRYRSFKYLIKSGQKYWDKYEPRERQDK